MKKINSILIIGQCSLHWGRMEFGNIGNYYIAEPFFEELRRVFPNAVLKTTMQFSDSFCERFRIRTLPLECYYDFNSGGNLETAKREFESAIGCEKNIESRYIEEVESADLVIDFSGDIWGDNADFLGKDRFEVGLYKDMTAQVLKPTVMLAGSPGPFSDERIKKLAKKVFEGFKMVTNREPISTRILKAEEFDTSHVVDSACPSFLFQQMDKAGVSELLRKERIEISGKPAVGFILCGWNFEKGPYGLWPREDSEYETFVKTITNMIDKYDVQIYLISHTNGFKVPPADFELIRGRDYPLMEQLEQILDRLGYRESVTLIRTPYLPKQIKGIIGELDMLISGRMHGAVAGISQCIPTVMIDYGHEPKAHKVSGFAEIAGLEEFIASPANPEQLLETTERCWNEKEKLQDMLKKRIPEIQEEVRRQFEMLKDILN